MLPNVSIFYRVDLHTVHTNRLAFRYLVAWYMSLNVTLMPSDVDRRWQWSERSILSLSRSVSWGWNVLVCFNVLTPRPKLKKRTLRNSCFLDEKRVCICWYKQYIVMWFVALRCHLFKLSFCACLLNRLGTIIKHQDTDHQNNFVFCYWFPPPQCFNVKRCNVVTLNILVFLHIFSLKYH